MEKGDSEKLERKVLILFTSDLGFDPGHSKWSTDTTRNQF